MPAVRAFPDWAYPTAGLVVVAALLLPQALKPAEGPRAPITGLVHVATLDLAPPNADVWYHDGHAYVGTWAGACPGTGVKIVDVQDPANPRLAGALAAYPNTSAEDVVVHEVSTPRFTGALLAVGLQSCTPAGRAGLDLWDVTDPAAPRHLAFFHAGPEGVHELSMVQRPLDGRVLALLAVPFAEVALRQGDFKIVDATDPERPVLAADWGLTRERGAPPGEGVGSMPVSYAHSAFPSPDGLTAYVSYWDAGVQILDIRDPQTPRFLGNTTYAPGTVPPDAPGTDVPGILAQAERNAHSVDVAPEAGLLLQADEDFTYRTTRIRVTEPAEAAGLYEAADAAFGPRLNASLAVNATVVGVGRGCFNDTYSVSPRDRIALVDRGDCTFIEKAQKATEAGARAVLVANHEPGPAFQMAGGDNVTNVTIPAYMIDLANATRIKTALGNATVNATLSPDLVEYDAWGVLRIYDVEDPGRPVQVGVFGTNHSINRPAPDDGGRYSIHNPVWLPGDEAVVASWFSDGVRILDLRDPARPREIAAWTPPDRPSPAADPGVAHPLGGSEAKADVWGVFVDGDTVYASDMGRGLHVLRIERGGS